LPYKENKEIEEQVKSNVEFIDSSDSETEIECVLDEN
jgi:hypothetical protein